MDGDSGDAAKDEMTCVRSLKFKEATGKSSVKCNKDSVYI